MVVAIPNKKKREPIIMNMIFESSILLFLKTHLCFEINIIAVIHLSKSGRFFSIDNINSFFHKFLLTY